MEGRAVQRFARVSPRKARYVADMIRGKDVDDALGILHFTPRSAASMLHKVLLSALSNAEQKGGVNVDRLFVREVFVDEGPTMRRFQARAQGRAYRIRKRTSHITVVLDDDRA